jgi:mono/diheme cytochrome c family protein
VRRVVILVSGLLLVTALAVSAREPKNEDGPAAQLRKAPRRAQLLQNPLAGQETAAAGGRKLYDDHCAQCHGSDAHGREHAVDLHSPAIQSAPDGSLFWALRNGRIRRGMPSWASLPDQQLWQLVTYLRTLK